MEPKKYIYEEQKILSKIEKRINELLRKSQKNTPQKVCKDNLFDAIRYTAPRYGYKRRFLNKERITMPDIDIDFPDDERDKVIEYVGKKYGENKVAHIATFGTFKVKLAIRDTARVLKTNENSLKQVIKVIDKSSYDKLKDIIENSNELLRLMNDYEDIDKLLTIASKIEGLPRNTSTHAAGIIITTHDLVNYTALDNGLDGIYQTQFEASDLEALGLLKMDFLGLRNLTTIDSCVKLIKKDIPSFTLPKMYNDHETFAMLARGDVDGVFQLESEGMRKTLMNLKVSKFDDINHALALYRPGPMDSIPSFIKRKFGQEKIEYYHKDLEPILKETYGIIIYQEQIINLVQIIANFNKFKASITVNTKANMPVIINKNIFTILNENLLLHNSTLHYLYILILHLQ